MVQNKKASQKINKTPLHLKEWYDDTNLHFVNWRHARLQELVQQHALGYGEALVFVNKAKNRVRLVINWGLPILVLLPIDPEGKRSVELEVSLFLQKLRTAPNLTSNQADQIRALQHLYTEYWRKNTNT